MIDLLYALIALLATTVGAVAGLGGGVVIKPLLDLVGQGDAATIGVYSAVAVFAMCLVSVARQVQSGFRFDRTVVRAISVGTVGVARRESRTSARSAGRSATSSSQEVGCL